MRRHIFISTLLLTVSTVANADWSTSERSVMMLYPGVDEVWGSSLVVVENKGKQTEKVAVPILLPKELSDFNAQEGVSQNQLQAKSDGRIIAELEVAPGQQMIGVGFKVAANKGMANLTFNVHRDIPNLSVIIPKQPMKMESSDFEEPRAIAFGEQQQNLFTKLEVAAGESFSIRMTNIPRGRGQLWLLGSLLSLVLIISVSYLAWGSKPKLNMS